MNQKYLWYVVGLLVIVLVVVGVRKKENSLPVGSASPSPSVSVSTTKSPAPRPAATRTPVPSGGAVTQSYTQAVAAHEGRRFQFDAQCHTNIARVVVKNGQTIMLDNRSGDPRTVVVGSTQYELAGYGWRVLTMTSKSLPATVYIDCESLQNVAQVVIEK